jgi:hypothetical protein
MIAGIQNDINPTVAIEWSHEQLLSEIPPNILKDLNHIVLDNPVRNTQWTYLKFYDNSVFKPAANAFNRSLQNAKDKNLKPSYTNSIPGTTQYLMFWKEEKSRCINGYEPIIDGKPCGIRIPGEFYFYLNYIRIMKYSLDPNTGEELKVLDFPDFCSMDYYWFLELEKNENPSKYGLQLSDKKGIICAKARRKGFSFKNAAGAIWKYTFFKNSFIIIASYLKDYAEATMSMALTMSNFLNEYTEFRHPRIINRNDEIKSGYIEKDENNMPIEKGYLSTIKIMTFQNSAFKSVGKFCTRMIFEEAGLFENLKSSYTTSEPLWKDGDRMIGIPILFGTGGDMASATQDFADMFYNPSSYGLAEYDNIYENTDINGKCGWFVDEMWFRPSRVSIDNKIYEGVDKSGNAIRWVAEWSLDKERLIKKNSDKKTFDLLLTQKCKTPSEAFLITQGNVFQTAELYARLSKLKADDSYKYQGSAGELIEFEGEVKWIPDLENKLRPIYNFPLKSGQDAQGAIVIYEHPITINGQVPEDLYILGHDPWGIDAEGGKSLGSTYVIKSKKYALQGYGHDQIVAEYVGRPDPGGFAEYNYNLEKLAVYYNGKINFENDRGEVKPYFQKRKMLHLLCPPPFNVIRKDLPNSTMGNRKYGYSMGNDKIKQIGEQYLYDWLNEKRIGEDGLEYTTIDFIPSKPLLEELITYRRKGNFDRVLSMIGCIIRLEDTHNPYEKDKDEKHVLDFLNNNPILFKKNKKHIYS